MSTHSSQSRRVAFKPALNKMWEYASLFALKIQLVIAVVASNLVHLPPSQQNSQVHACQVCSNVWGILRKQTHTPTSADYFCILVSSLIYRPEDVGWIEDCIYCTSGSISISLLHELVPAKVRDFHYFPFSIGEIRRRERRNDIKYSISLRLQLAYQNRICMVPSLELGLRYTRLRR